MNDTSDELSSADDPRVLRAVQEYLAELEAGRRPDRQALEERFPDLAGVLDSYFDALDLVEGAAARLKSTGAERRQSPPAAEPAPAAPLGDFRILREIGCGGMGVVYEAEQLSLGRRVALKVLPFAAGLDARQLQRFLTEARAAAHLHHPNIVPVYFVGSDRGVHFYAMQLIEGQNLGTLAAEVRRRSSVSGGVVSGEWSKASDHSPLTTPPLTELGAEMSTQRSVRPLNYYRSVAGLVAQAAEGLDYAHGLGIVHRDVKPANLLVDGRGNVWVTDFGLALFHAENGLTRTGDLLGTLLYMSPEQAGGARGVVDQRTDVYSLGATLYELLTLRPIFDGTDRQTLLRQILHDEPRPPRQHDRTIPPELETIVLKAVEKSPADRYRTARELADDLRRFLGDEPILARRAGPLQRARKWLRRHPSVTTSAAVLLVLVAALSLLSAWLVRGEQGKTKKALVQERERFEMARRAADSMIEIANEELDGPQYYGARKRMLEAALEYYQEFIDLHRDDPAARERLAQTHGRVRQVIADLAALQGAGRIFLLNDEDILKDLDLSPGQRQKVAELTRRLDEQRPRSFEGYAQLTAEDRRKRFLDVARENDKALSAVLSKQQVERLRQIDLQCQGLTAFREPEVIARLKLTAAQRDRIRDIEAEMIRSHLGPGPGPRRGPRDLPPPPPRLGPPSKEEHAAMLAWAFERLRRELKPEQLRAWKELTGEPLQGGVPFRPAGAYGPR